MNTRYVLPERGIPRLIKKVVFLNEWLRSIYGLNRRAQPLISQVHYLGEKARREHLINLVPVQASADAANIAEPLDVAIVTSAIGANISPN
jgi:hypothetical protein